MLSKFYHRLPLLFLCVALAAVALLDTSCTKWQLRRANKNYTQQAYSRAAKKYVKVLPKLTRPQQPEVLFRLAESNRLVGNLQQAETYYSRILRLAGDNVNPNVYLGLAKVQQQAEKYSLAVENYDRYLLLAPLDSLHLSDRELCIALRDSTATATRYMVDNVRDFNSSK
ncbi:MAG: hypothetical protein LBS94_02985, partial [Prevotellaceae bacterium]|nr:hypothetical protein [Prevotellaceae bacterium]